jgi:hypothetical protein
MPRMGCREVHFIKATRPSQVDFLIDKVKEAVEGMKLPPEYDVRIYKNVYTCCGVGGLGLIIEVVGPEEEKIKEIDLRAVSKILEFCEKEGLDVGDHTLEQHESI